MPGLAEDVLLGNEARHVDWFLDAGARDVPPGIRDAFVVACTGRYRRARGRSVTPSRAPG